jgi:hypothetical protein
MFAMKPTLDADPTPKSVGKGAALAAAVAAGALMLGGLTAAYTQTPLATQLGMSTTTVAAQPVSLAGQPVGSAVQPLDPAVQPLDCWGTTGSMGCGPGWHWRDGWRGLGCYPC